MSNKNATKECFMSEAKRIAISVSEQMHESLSALAESQGVSLSRFAWAVLLFKLLEPGTQQMLAGIHKLPASDQSSTDPTEQD
jgi:hypothetical protein